MDLLSHSEKIIHPFTVDASLGMLMIEAYIGADKHIALSIDCTFCLVFLVLERLKKTKQPYHLSKCLNAEYCSYYRPVQFGMWR